MSDVEQHWHPHVWKLILIDLLSSLTCSMKGGLTWHLILKETKKLEGDKNNQNERWRGQQVKRHTLSHLDFQSMYLNLYGRQSRTQQEQTLSSGTEICPCQKTDQTRNSLYNFKGLKSFSWWHNNRHHPTEAIVIPIVTATITAIVTEGNLEVKLPTLWTDEKQSRAEAERRERLEERRVEEKESEERRCRCAKR